MKSVTEFANFTLNAAAKAKAALTTEGKTPEEIQESLGTTYKLEGDKLKYFMAAMDIAATNTENLKRVLVVSFAEGENVPKGATKVEETYYLPEFHVVAKKQEAHKGGKDAKGGRGGGRGGDRGGRGGGGGQKESPWGLSPEEKAAKLNRGAAGKNAAPAAAAGAGPVGKPAGKPAPKSN